MNVKEEVAEQDLEQLLRDGKIQEADEKLDAILESDENNVEALIKKARILILKNEGNLALELLEKALEIDPKNAAAKTYKAVIMGLCGQVKSLEFLLNTAIKLDPNFAPAHYNLAKHFAARDRLEEALKEFNLAAALDPENPTYALRIAQLELDMGKFEDALNNLSALINLFPKFPEPWLTLFKFLMKDKNPKKAKELISIGLTHCPHEVSFVLASFQASAALSDYAFCDKVCKILSDKTPKLAEDLGDITAILKSSTKDTIRKISKLKLRKNKGNFDALMDFLDSVLIARRDELDNLLNYTIQELKG